MSVSKLIDMQIWGKSYNRTPLSNRKEQTGGIHDVGEFQKHSVKKTKYPREYTA